MRVTRPSLGVPARGVPASRRARRIACFGLAGFLLAVLALTGCAGQQERTVTVLAAASLRESFDELGAEFEREHPGVRVRFDYQGSATLAEQINQGRRADVFASASPSNMRKVVDTLGVARGPTTFARNELTIAVPEGNPADIRSMADLRGNTVVTCAPEVPCGALAQRAAQRADVRLRPASAENDVKSVLRKVSEGEADAGLVYVTDVRSAGHAVRGVRIPPVRTPYPLAVLNDAPQPELAAEFAEFVTGPNGADVLVEHGFAKP